jgi:hypothetical protein
MKITEKIERELTFRDGNNSIVIKYRNGERYSIKLILDATINMTGLDNGHVMLNGGVRQLRCLGRLIRKTLAELGESV